MLLTKTTLTASGDRYFVLLIASSHAALFQADEAFPAINTLVKLNLQLIDGLDHVPVSAELGQVRCTVQTDNNLRWMKESHLGLVLFAESNAILERLNGTVMEVSNGISANIKYHN